MTYALLAAPGVEPLTLDEVKAHLRLDGADEDGLLTSLIRTARDHLERATGLAPITQRWRLYLDSVSEDGVIPIARTPLQSVEAARFYTATGTPVPIDPATLLLDRAGLPGRILLPGPVNPGRPLGGVEIDFTAGFGATPVDVPPSIRRALLLHVAAMFEYRGAVSAADQPAVLPEGYDRLLAPFRIWGL